MSDEFLASQISKKEVTVDITHPSKMFDFHYGTLIKRMSITLDMETLFETYVFKKQYAEYLSKYAAPENT